MAGIKRIDSEWSVSEHLTFKDEGSLYLGAKTRRFTVFSKTNRSPLACIKWMPTWRKYCLFPLDSVIFDSSCLRQLAEFCDIITQEHKAQPKGPNSLREQRLARRQKRINKLAKKKLTKLKNNETIVLVNESDRQIEPVPESEKPVVEGVNFNAPEVNAVQGDNNDS